MSTTIQIQLDDEIATHLGDSPDAVNAAAKQATVLELYRRHAISDWRGARLLGLDVGSFLKLAGSRFIPFIDLSPEELREELAAVERLWPNR